MSPMQGEPTRCSPGCRTTSSPLSATRRRCRRCPRAAPIFWSSNSCPFQMIRHKDNVYATQFHPEADGAVFEQRIRIYKDHGYFDPADAARLIADCHAQSVTMPERILRRFVERYR
ncbi:hypothetical protein [Oceaniradius stylonematis]|uniref:glutamine amidotransferase-related protein n=1 Tax=Oceaniradius stylonematis TaxID=2184161 RepID=UPI0035D0A102